MKSTFILIFWFINSWAFANLHGNIVISKHDQHQLGKRGTYSYFISLVIPNHRKVTSAEEIFSNYFLNDVLQKNIGSMNGVTIKDYRVVYHRAKFDQYQLINTTVKHGISQDFYSWCYISRKNTNTYKDIVSHECHADNIDKLFHLAPVQTVSCHLLENSSKIKCDFKGYGGPKDQSYVLGIVKRDATQLAIGGTTELIKTFVGIMSYMSDVNLDTKKISKISQKVDQITRVENEDIYSYMMNQFEDSGLFEVKVEY
jgi:hypothetical protein